MKKVVVVGAGIAGLSAAIYAQKSGYSVTLCEMHNRVGGMCTSWRRKGYLFEGAVHWLTGSNPDTQVNEVWKETAALDESVTIYRNDIFRTVDWEGSYLRLYRDIDRTAGEIAEFSPADEEAAMQLANDVKALGAIKLQVSDIAGLNTKNPRRMSWGESIKMLPALQVAARLNTITCEQFAYTFKHPAIRPLFSFIPKSHAALDLAYTLSTLNSGDGGYPEGGSLAMVDRMAAYFEELGGTIMLNTKIDEVIISNSAAVGVMAEEGFFLEADSVIVAQETISALKELFSQEFFDGWIADLNENTKPNVCTFLSIGIKAKLPESLPVWQLAEPIRYAGTQIDELSFTSYSRYEGYAPKGGTALTGILLEDTYDSWKQLKAQGRYESEKAHLANQLEQAFYAKYPNLKGAIEVIDIATPLTYERYTGAYRGSWMSMTSPGTRMQAHPAFIDGISSLYFASHRMMPPGGLPAALLSGRKAAQMVCKHDGAEFIAK
ncbi:MAG: NAD(P)/FAD-dependent oxidoreductase [Eubacteriaceae bacterium]|nr:NAD(P)/FAD-dependent oxidoreductase [Eubacteriaceae bacterium]